MARPRMIQDENLLLAARESFLEQGYGVSTAMIARRAGVSEGTLFKRFATKEDLFLAALGLEQYGLWRKHLLAEVGQGAVQRNLENAALSLFTESESVMSMMMAVFSRGIAHDHNPMLARIEEISSQDYRALSEYLQAEIMLGRVRPVDTEIVSLAFHGSLLAYMQRYHLHRSTAPPAQPVEPARFVRGLLDTLWPGLQP